MEIELLLHDSAAFKNLLKDSPHERGEVELLESVR